ncbi:MAG TPA: hypothetical protein VFB14_12530 [Bryobacteraceae bacterium]|nr:hypothetical protein [Bryobacteraceae bacterium]
MKKLMIAALGLSLLSGTAVFAAQNSGQTETSTMSKKKTKHKKGKNSTSSTTSTESSPKS